MKRRWGVALVAIVTAHTMFLSGKGFTELIILINFTASLELTEIQRGILLRLLDSKDENSVSMKLHRNLAYTLSNKYVNLALSSIYLITVYLGKREYYGLMLIQLFVAVIYLKIFSFNKNLNDLNKLCDEFERNPKETQIKFNKSQLLFVEKINAKYLRQQRNSKTEITIPSLEELKARYCIDEVSQIRQCLNQRAFINKALVITCWSMLLESFGHFFLTYQLSQGIMAYNLEPVLMFLMC
mmetsp:Transcript_14177/g.24092  ORF Transcript_14177/g.24092 Transcript_14177/m.24092 type:complete len:241 (+) Transcript_14177:158-880(+)|eukprot:CAMPEP_0168615576 /NCGR_PEP_ID=MMETSP0449_2-20121227/4575_1 /TAXON_ID=1082188 /ORGANISM="Strombidium rassoulzadegani, Strain ras09" /LENGTH=240 /DNA_ID=CAMNT_0008656319 /DNA_START=92 /DNA_END=814 /DNA_ORIENTATION=-